MARLEWTREHKSKCGRFWCYKPPRSDEWQLWDLHDRDERNNAKRSPGGRTLTRCKEIAQHIAETKQPT